MSKIEAGFYAKKQIFSKDRLIAWSHRRRFEIGLDILRDLHPRRLLDYGSGDGTLLAMLSEQEWRPECAVGAELKASILADSQRRFEGLAGIEFCLISALDAKEHCAKYDTVVCMEVLEHVTDLETVLGQLDYVLAPGGRIAISVPVETGLPVFFKQTARRIAGWRNVGDYKYTSHYTAPEMLKSIFAGSNQHIVRPTYHSQGESPFHDHKGFNWRYMRKAIGQRFEIKRTVASPIAALGPHLTAVVLSVGGV
jgi:2-polyprenyl-3-methyl-5-hydroxy-6-metoxy-1,4-benzoquinol methylase